MVAELRVGSDVVVKECRYKAYAPFTMTTVSRRKINLKINSLRLRSLGSTGETDSER